MILNKLLEGIETGASNMDMDADIASLAIDSRKVAPGALFIAIPGAAQDGHLFIPDAMKKGAAGILSEWPLSPEIPHVVVPSTRKALALAAANFYDHPVRKLRFAGITGTNGKTTVSFLLRHILESTGHKTGLLGTVWNLTGSQTLETSRTTPDALTLQGLLHEMVLSGCSHCVMEVSSHALDQGRVEGIRYDAAAMTNLTPDHLDYHGTMERYFEAKARLFKQSDTAVLNLDDPYCRRLGESGTCKVITYTTERQTADLMASNIHLDGRSVCFELVAGGEKAEVTLSIPGKFSIYNALCALGCAVALGVELRAACTALESARGVSGRVEVVPVPAQYSVIIDYAHTPDALENIIRTAKGFTDNNLIVLFGCGGDRDTAKRPMMGEIVGRLADVAVVTSDNPRTERPSSIIDDIIAGMAGTSARRLVVEDRRAAIRRALEEAGPGDVVLLCGKGHELYQEVDGVKLHLDEREEVGAYFEERADQNEG